MNVCAAAQRVLCSKLIFIIRNESKLFHSIFKVYKTKRSQKGKSYCWRLLSNLTWLKHPARAAAFQTFEFLFGATHPCRHLAVCALCGWLPAYSFFLIFKVHLLLCMGVGMHGHRAGHVWRSADTLWEPGPTAHHVSLHHQSLVRISIVLLYTLSPSPAWVYLWRSISTTPFCVQAHKCSLLCTVAYSIPDNNMLCEFEAERQQAVPGHHGE